MIIRTLITLVFASHLIADDSNEIESISLFNGKDLTGWTTKGSAKWKVIDGIIKGGQDGNPSKSGILLSEKIFKDFDLRLEFKIDEHGKFAST